MSTYFDVHVIQTVPPSNVNRDDAGEPKTARYGGVNRARVSSQSWKRATREYFVESVDPQNLGIRSLRVVQLVADAIIDQDPDLAGRERELAEKIFGVAKIKVDKPKKATAEDGSEEAMVAKYLIFLSTSQIQQLAEEAVAATREDRNIDAKKVKALFNSKNSADIALFGRMIADNPDLNVDAACQVAHAISTHAVETEYDFFTAVDDAKAALEDSDAGAGMMGTVGFNSSTLYRYATVNLDMLRKNMGEGPATVESLTAFVEAFAMSMPTGKQNTFANRTVPNTVVVTVRDDQPVSLASAFERPIVAGAGGGYATDSVSALAVEKARIEGAFAGAPAASYVVTVEDLEALKLGKTPDAVMAIDGLGDRMDLKSLLEHVSADAVDRLAEDEA